MVRKLTGKIAGFRPVSVSVLKDSMLKELNNCSFGFMELSQMMNCTPTIESFLEFAGEMKRKGFDFKFEGFAFDPHFEKDRSVCLEGIYRQEDCTPEIGLAFAKFVSGYQPDELSIKESFLMAWRE